MSVDFYISFQQDKDSDPGDNEFRANHVGNFNDYSKNPNGLDFLNEFEQIIGINNHIVDEKMIDLICLFWDKVYSHVEDEKVKDYYYESMIDQMVPTCEIKDYFVSNIGKYVAYRID